MGSAQTNEQDTAAEKKDTDKIEKVKSDMLSFEGVGTKVLKLLTRLVKIEPTGLAYILFLRPVELILNQDCFMFSICIE